MANTFKSGSAVESGYYLNVTQWAVVPVAKEGGHLPGGKGEWQRIPTVAALALAPMLGLTFLMALPMIGFALTFQAIASPITNLFRTSAKDLAATVSPGWQPGEAHFTGKSPENAGTEEKGPMPQDAQLEALAKEIEQKRRQG